MRTAAAKGTSRPHGLAAALAVVMLAASCSSSSSALTAAATGAIYEARYVKQ